MLGDFEEDRKPNIEYLDALNEHNKRSRSVEDEADSAAERKLARVVGWDQGQVAPYGGGDVPMNGVVEEGSGVADAGVDNADAPPPPPEDDPIVYGWFPPSFHAIVYAQPDHSSGW